MICRKQLSTGEELYVVDENQFICKDDYMNKTYGELLFIYLFLKDQFVIYVVYEYHVLCIFQLVKVDAVWDHGVLLLFFKGKKTSKHFFGILILIETDAVHADSSTYC